MEQENRNHNNAAVVQQPQMGAAMQTISPEENPAYQEFLRENIVKGKKTYNYVMLMFVVYVIVTNGIELLAQLFLGGKYGEQEWFSLQPDLVFCTLIFMCAPEKFGIPCYCI